MHCRHCRQPLLPENIVLADGCPCNSGRGVNHGLVHPWCCTCRECDPAQTGSSRVRHAVDVQQMCIEQREAGRKEAAAELEAAERLLAKIHRDVSWALAGEDPHDWRKGLEIVKTDLDADDAKGEAGR